MLADFLRIFAMVPTTIVELQAGCSKPLFELARPMRMAGVSQYCAKLLPMNLPDTFKMIAPSVIGFVKTLVQSPNGNEPIAPVFFATGFVVDPIGIVATNRHVVESFPNIPKHPKTGRAALGAIYCHYGMTPEGKDFIRWIPIDVKYSTVVDQFSSASTWHGDDEPDIGFVQLTLRDLPALPLARHDRYVEPGKPIATAGYPMGEAALIVS